MTIILSNLNRLIFFTGKFPVTFVVKWILKLPPHLAYVAALPRETLMSAKRVINVGIYERPHALFEVLKGINHSCDRNIKVPRL